ncbi:MAG TPA: NAD-dependent epimerase/dehydratase family protein [Pseudonocardia sp.]|nr:NAD-dependent epimerase/dehydratase family protein [Pseudonocardia sp.]
MRVLVTGAAGYVGGAVLDALLAAGHEPVAHVHGAPCRVPAGVPVCIGDLLDDGPNGSGDHNGLVAALAGVDAVCHLAGLTRVRESWDRPLDYFAVNVGGTVAVLRAMESAGVDRLVLASTAACYGSPARQPMAEQLPDDPPHPYASSKVAAESVIGWEARRRPLSAVVLRLFNAAGGAHPGPAGLIPRVLAVAEGQSPELAVNGDGGVVRDYLHVTDAAAAFVAALHRPPPPGTVSRYNIGSGVGSSIADVVATAARVTGRPVPVRHNPPAAEPARLVCDPALALAELGWRPRLPDLESVLREAWRDRSEAWRDRSADQPEQGRGEPTT